MKLATPNQLIAQADLFENAARKLREIAALLDSGDTSENVHPPLHTVNKGDGENNQKSPTFPTGKRFPQIRDYLKAHGPSTRSAVLAGTGLPLGTLATVLSIKKGFQKDKQGLWFYPEDVKDASR